MDAVCDFLIKTNVRRLCGAKLNACVYEFVYFSNKITFCFCCLYEILLWANDVNICICAAAQHAQSFNICLTNIKDKHDGCVCDQFLYARV